MALYDGCEKNIFVRVINDDCDTNISSTIQILDDMSVSLLTKYIAPTLLHYKYISSGIKDIISLQTKGCLKTHMA